MLATLRHKIYKIDVKDSGFLKVFHIDVINYQI